MQDTCDVLVVGAGLAGLTAARQLANAGLDVIVLEHQNEPGGRVKEDAASHVDLGPSWIHGVSENNATAALFAECGGLPSQLVPSSRGNW